MFNGRLDHVGHVVRDFDKALDLYRNKFGLTPKTIMDFPEFGSRMAFFSFAGSEIEVIQPGAEGVDPAGKCLKERGEGIFHFSIRVDDYDGEVKKWKDRGFTVTEYTHNTPGHIARLAFLNPEEIMGLWIEFIKEEEI